MKPKSWMYKRALVHALYLGLSLLFATRFFSLTRLTSHAITDGDPALNAWVLQWMSHALVHDPLHWYAGNTFYPYPHAIVLADPLPISASHQYSPSAPDRFIAQYQKTRSEPLAVLHPPIFYFREPYPTDEARYMTDSTWHWARVLNGFSGGEPIGFMERMRTLNTLPEPATVSLVRELGVDVIAVHGAAAHAGNPLWDFFSQQDWTRVVKLPNDEFVVMVKR